MGSYKYIHCDFDPPQLYDLSKDPMEKHNLTEDPAHANTAQSFAEEVSQRWDSETLRNNIIKTQKSRHALHTAMEAGAGEHWDYNPPSDASQQYDIDSRLSKTDLIALCTKLFRG